MAHVQEQILTAVVDRLIDAGTAAGANVFLDRVDPLQDDELPALLVFEAPQGESAQPYTVSGIEQRQYAVRIAGVVSHGSAYGARARDLGLQVEKALSGNAALLRLAKGGARIASSRLTLSGDAEEARAAREQTWLFTYLVRPTAPDIAV
ncbi:hypothetical protein [Variovorax sp. V15]|uniref:hypothetical protein n=1 Tax=Variovorax sp. V15 TaxID=3065952 RepID=UPI0034E89863